jgi:hypothetical protein
LRKRLEKADADLFAARKGAAAVKLQLDQVCERERERRAAVYQLR